jgi:hypothetical protein
MKYNYAASSNQVKNRRVTNKYSLDRLQIISPILISRAAAVARRQLRYQKRLDVLALSSLIVFVQHSKQIIHNHPPVDDGYIYNYEGSGIVIYTPEDYYEHMVHNTVSRLAVILEYHRTYLSPQAATVIKEALDWHVDKYQQIKKWHNTSLADLIYASSHCRVVRDEY